MAAIPSAAMVVAVAVFGVALVWLAGLARPGSIPDHLALRATGLLRTTRAFQRQQHTWAACLVVLGALALAGLASAGEAVAFVVGAGAAVLVGSGAVLATVRAAVASVAGWIEDVEADGDEAAGPGREPTGVAAPARLTVTAAGGRPAATPPLPPPAPPSPPGGDLATAAPPPGPPVGYPSPDQLRRTPVPAADELRPLRPVVRFRSADEPDRPMARRPLPNSGGWDPSAARRPAPVPVSERPAPAPAPDRPVPVADRGPSERERPAAAELAPDPPAPTSAPAVGPGRYDGPPTAGGTPPAPGLGAPAATIASPPTATGGSGPLDADPGIEPLGLGPVLPVVRGAGVIGLGATALGLGGVAAVVLAVTAASGGPGARALGPFGLGLALVAMLARVGSSLLVAGEDLAARSEAPDPEDDGWARRGATRTPAVVLARVVGATVDRVESYAGSLLAPIALGALALGLSPAEARGTARTLLFLPLVVALVGLAASAGLLLLGGTSRGADGADGADGGGHPHLIGAGTTALVTLTGTVLAGLVLVRGPGFGHPLGPAVSVAGGIVLGLALDRPLLEAVAARLARPGPPPDEGGPDVGAGSRPGPGSGLDLLVAVTTIVLVAVGLFLAWKGGRLTVGPGLTGGAGIDLNGFAGFYGLALGAVGLLAPTAEALARSLGRPVGVAAESLAEDDSGADDADELADAIDEVAGHRAPSIATAAGVLSALALVGVFGLAVRAAARDGGQAGIALGLGRPVALVGLLAGAAAPVVLVSLAQAGTARVAGVMAAETARQDRLVPGLRRLRPGSLVDPGRWMARAAGASLREALWLGLLGAALPALIGLLSVNALAGFLAGAVAASLSLATVVSALGPSAPDADADIDAVAGPGAGHEPAGRAALAGPTDGAEAAAPGPSPALAAAKRLLDAATRRAAGVATAVGDPFDEVAAASLVSLLKVMALVSLVLAPAFVAAA